MVIVSFYMQRNWADRDPEESKASLTVANLLLTGICKHISVTDASPSLCNLLSGPFLSVPCPPIMVMEATFFLSSLQ